MKITEEQFFEEYQPIENPNTGEYIFDTYGEDLEHVLQIANNEQISFIWTGVSCDNEDIYLIPGYHLVNREFYYICKVPWSNTSIEVNYNEIITKKQAITTFIDFWNKNGFRFDRRIVCNHFTEKEYTIGKAKYDGIELFENLTSNELSGIQEDLIHDWYNSI